MTAKDPTGADRTRRYRARQKTAKSAAELAAQITDVAAQTGRPLRDVSQLLWPAVSEALASLALKPEDAGARKLAQRYAQVIDQAGDQEWAMRWIAPLLLTALDALGATPAARAAMTKGAKPAPEAAPSRLAQLRTAGKRTPA